MSAWQKLHEQILLEKHGVKPGETWHPLPDLCVLSADELKHFRLGCSQRQLWMVAHLRCWLTLQDATPLLN